MGCETRRIRRSWHSVLNLEQIGVGAFYYIASTAVIGVMDYAGVGCGPHELMMFFGVLGVSFLVTKVAAAAIPFFRDYLAEWQGVPSVAIVLCAMLCACLSMLSPLKLLLYVCALFTGIACAGMVVSWERSLSRMPIRRDLFEVPSSLLVAVACYLVYRALSFLSLTAADGWHVTVGVVGMLALLMAFSPEYTNVDKGRMVRPFTLLGCVAAILATGGGLFAYLCGYPGSAACAPFTPYLTVEIMGAVTLCLCCIAGGKMLRSRRFIAGRSGLALIGIAIAILLILGAASGFSLAANGGNGLLWEASVWVLVLAALALGMRTSLYLVCGMPVGVLFAAWCVGQSLALWAALSAGTETIWNIAVPACLLGVYLASTLVLLYRPMGYQVVAEGGAIAVPSEETGSEVCLKEGDSAESEAPATAEDSLEPTNLDEDLGKVYQEMSDEYHLTAREAEVLQLIVEGRSARFIAEELVISYNTARSHTRNVYEKLGIHSKQDLITLVRSWSS